MSMKELTGGEFLTPQRPIRIAADERVPAVARALSPLQRGHILTRLSVATRSRSSLTMSKSRERPPRCVGG